MLKLTVGSFLKVTLVSLLLDPFIMVLLPIGLLLVTRFIGTLISAGHVSCTMTIISKNVKDVHLTGMFN